MVPVVILFVLAEDRLRLLRRPRLVLELLLLFGAGLSFYLFIVFRALTGPTALYGDLRSVDGFLAFVTGAQFRIDMRFGTAESLAEAWRAVPDLVAGIQQRANVAFSLVLLAGAVTGPRAPGPLGRLAGLSRSWSAQRRPLRGLPR